ncbi:MAG TPA: Crp/Fnr family transcriptional regulator [Spirochaetia bacterium]|nr:Crp/Fnr family transcriptional regulator [Spirochaetia bacterium]
MADDSALYQKFGNSVDPGQIIFKEGETGNQMYIIQEGRVRVSKKIGGREHILAVLGKSDFFGEMAIVTNVKRTATVSAIDDVKVLCFNREGFISMINKNPKIALNIIDKLCRRLQHSNMQIQHLVKRNARALVALNLYYAFKGENMANTVLYYDRTVEGVSLNLEIPLETVKSLFDDFQRENIIKIAGNQISVTDMNRLSEIVEGVAG